jgi:hypothetical protein
MLGDPWISTDRQVHSWPVVVLLLASLLAVATAAGEEYLFELSIEQLMEKEITSTAALTQTSARLTPAAVTTITAEQIHASGARSLFELLDIYAPNLQWMRNHWEADNLGLRGIINDRDDKYLLLVNGRVMNERTHYGVVSERDLVMLRDIHHIDVVRGPGSALYGPIVVGMQREWGIELEALYHTGKTRLGISRGFTKLHDFDLADPCNLQVGVTSEPYGYGNDLAWWANHITKITGRHKLDDEWTVDGSLRIYWRFPGMKDYHRYLATMTEFPDFSPGWESAYRGNYYLNLGLQYQPQKNLTVRIDGYNLLGLFDKDLSKRSYSYGRADYRSHAVAAARHSCTDSDSMI